MRPAALLFPARCMLCQTYLPDSAHGICDTCRDQLEQEMPWLVCTPPDQLDALVCAARYGGQMRRAIADVKFRGRRAGLTPMAQLMTRAWETHHMPKPDAVTCVPVSPVRMHTRGFNQSAELAQRIAQQWDVPFVPMLRRRVLARRQSVLHAHARWDNAKRAFSLRDGAENLSGRQIVLVDDIVTTGATLSTCAGLLRGAGASHVYGLALARAGENK